jgi:hypothetical protein
MAAGRSFGPATTLTLHAGDKVVLDYLPGAPESSFYRGYMLSGTESKSGAFRYFSAVPGQSGGCQAVGMTLEVGLEPAKTDALVEAELWLVRPNRDGTERSDRQVVQLPVGHLYRYFFDEARLAQPAAASSAFARVSGDLAITSVENGRIRFNFKVTRWYGTSPDADTSSTYRDLVAAPGEVLAFQLPAEGGQKQPPLSIRLRANVLK